MRIYVGVCSWGSYDLAEKTNISASLNPEDVIKALNEWVFPDPDQNWGIMEIWLDGKKIKEEVIVE